VLGAQCDIWRSTRQDAKTVAFFDGYKEMNATTVSVGIPWSKIETSENEYDFRFLDWFIEQAESHDLKLVINLFNTNVCGKVQEAAPGGTFYPQYAPAYLLEAPEEYQRMVLPGPWKYAAGGPPMCPNDPDTLERERRYVARVAEHLKAQDRRRTVIMLQIDNEFYYQQWEGDRPKDEKAIRCRCPYCEKKYDPAKYRNEEEFMFTSFAGYAKVLTDEIAGIYDIPLYLNSPWWDPAIIPIFLDRCSDLDFIGIDGVFAPNEPNMLSRSQVSRNIPFAAENPTENAATRFNLDVLPYYSVAGQQGLGNLLWECGPPRTVVEDEAARRKYGQALYPLKHAQWPIIRARGTENFVGWYAVRDFAPETTTDAFGNYVPCEKDASPVTKQGLFVRQGKETRMVEGDAFEFTTGGLTIAVSQTQAGIVIATGPSQLVVATPRAKLVLRGARRITAEQGRFVRDQWMPAGTFNTLQEDNTTVLDVTEAKVVRVAY
jgi:hypothetical protein